MSNNPECIRTTYLGVSLYSIQTLIKKIRRRLKGAEALMLTHVIFSWAEPRSSRNNARPECNVSCWCVVSVLFINIPALCLWCSAGQAKEGHIDWHIVVGALIKPKTQKKEISYVERLAHKHKSKQRKFVGPANVFVSHAWSDDAIHALEALETFGISHQEKELYYWLDVCSENLHQCQRLLQTGEQGSSIWFGTTLPDIIQSCGRAVLLAPQHASCTHPSVCGRLWCCFEVVSLRYCCCNFQYVKMQHYQINFESSTVLVV